MINGEQQAPADSSCSAAGSLSPAPASQALLEPCPVPTALPCLLSLSPLPCPGSFACPHCSVLSPCPMAPFPLAPGPLFPALLPPVRVGDSLQLETGRVSGLSLFPFPFLLLLLCLLFRPLLLLSSLLLSPPLLSPLPPVGFSWFLEISSGCEWMAAQILWGVQSYPVHTQMVLALGCMGFSQFCFF